MTDDTDRPDGCAPCYYLNRTEPNGLKKTLAIAVTVIGVLIMSIGGVIWSETQGNAEDVTKLKNFHGVDYRDAQAQLNAIRTDLALLVQARRSDSVAIADITVILKELRR